MSELRSAVDTLRSEVLSEASNAQIEGDLVELHAIGEALEAERLRRLAEFDRRRSFELDGHLSAAAWLASRLRVGWGEARRAVAQARQVGRMPATIAAFEAGNVSLTAVRMLAEARAAEPDAFDEAEHTLVDAASRHTLPDLRRVLAHWRRAVENDRPDTDDRLRSARRLHASVTFGGMVRIDGDLDPEAGASVMAALRAVLDADSRSGIDGDDRTAPQRRADALGEICRAWLDSPARPSISGERPHLNVTVPIGLLLGRDEDAPAPHEGASELELAGPITEAAARRLACDASVTRIVFGPRSEPLDVGRRTPIVPPAIRRAIVARDRHCRFPGCDRPQAWCDAHHVVHWGDGGPTSVANLLLLCRRHHRLVHERFSLEMTDGRPMFRRRDGSGLDDGRAPP